MDSALEKLQNHDLLIRLDPEFSHYETLLSPAESPNTKRYKVTDHMHTLPKGLWDTTVTFESLITNTEDGVAWVIKAPLGLVQRQTWRLMKTKDVDEGKETVAQSENERVGEGEEKSEWSLVEDVEIKASRLLVGTVKNKCEASWKGIHRQFVKKLTEVPGNGGVAVEA